MHERATSWKANGLALALAALLAATAAVVALAPEAVMDAVGARMRRGSTSPDFSFGLAAFLVALIPGVAARRLPLRPGAAVWLAFAAGLLGFWFWTRGFSHWWIDDAGVTFAYARSLADGIGLTFHPNRAPEEGYSSTLWMGLLAAAAALGAAIPAAAKSLAFAFTGAALAAATWVIWRELRERAPLAVAALIAGCAVAPVVVWTASGQEHALQGLLITLVPILAWRGGSWRIGAAIILAALVLTRPEAPLLVIAAFTAALGLSRMEEGRWAFWRNLPVALIPFIAFLALMAFRWFYFGDLFPNPYYAKATGSTLSGLVNPFGGGWSYVLRGLAETALLILAPFALMLRLSGVTAERRRLIVIAAALIAAHLAFVIWARGDWMGQFRFLAPIIPLFALVSILGLADFAPAGRRRLLLAAMALIFVQSTVVDLVRYRGRPTTPMAEVSRVGDAFANLAERLGIEGATLAHHDAGGIALDRRIELVDLGGLVDRTIAKNMGDAAALGAYIFDARKPTFIFGARNFAARSGVFDDPAFTRDYAPLVFETSGVRSKFCHIRRDAVRPGPGVEIRRENGEIVEVRVR